MRRRSRFVLLVVAAVAGAALLGACGGDDDDGGGESVSVTDGRVTVEAEDTKYDITQIDTVPGLLDVTMVQRGNLDHTFVVEDADGNDLDGKLAVNGQDEDSGTFELEAGEYEYFCDIPGHRGQGMEGTLVVE
jgi:plastocyanin